MGTKAGGEDDATGTWTIGTGNETSTNGQREIVIRMGHLSTAVLGVSD